MSKRLLLLVMATLLCMFVAVGCGSDGSDGKAGQDVDPGTVTALQQQIDALLAQIEALEESGSASTEEIQALLAQIAELEAQRDAEIGVGATIALRKEVIESNNDLSATLSGGNIEITFSFKDAKGNPFKGYKNFNTVYFHYLDAQNQVVRARIQSSSTATALPNAFTQPTDGNYKITFPANGGSTTGSTLTDIQKLAELLALPEVDRDIRILVTFVNDNTDLADTTGWYRYYANVQKDYGTAPRDLFSKAACASCHGEKIFNRGNNSAINASHETRKSTYGYHYAASNGENCTVCHSYASKEAANPNKGGNLVAYVHGVHVSTHDEPVQVKSGVYYAIGYPNNMQDCVVCHDSPARVAEVTQQKYFNYYTCMSCHQSWDSWDLVGTQVTDVSFHEDYTGATSELACVSCHNGGLAPTFAQFHGGYDLSTKYASDFTYKIYSITVNGAGDFADVVWGVEDADGDNYNLINNDLDAGPTFGNLTMWVGYGKGDDWTNIGMTSAQPSTTNRLSAAAGALTTNGTNVYNAMTNRMTTTVPVAAGAGETRGAIVIHNRPSLKVGDVTLTGYTGPLVSGIAVPFDVAANGTELALRRSIVDDAKCIACHGSNSGFHGTSGRVIGTQMCVVCHNPGATEKNRRASYYGVNASTALDGKDEESYDLKNMLHRIHSAGATDKPYILYRQQGTSIWAFFGKILPAGWGVNPVGTNAITANFNDVQIYYPQDLTNCEACHNPGTYSDAGVGAVPVTLGQGASLTVDSDDTIVGPAKAACASCHTGDLLKSGNDASLKAHFNFVTSKSQTGGEGCATCHNGSYAPGH
ncbi:multiheme c-type cytochrome [Geovibrio ferrireducens]|uniref:multiheme c-type cytochrome n=1 Tax=Geovibrio ferrireducens TaxID=46201 RepID=UPI002246B356|nr:cytochrome c3 family protein [Geovibrio ferrireducens]